MKIGLHYDNKRYTPKKSAPHPVFANYSDFVVYYDDSKKPFKEAVKAQCIEAL